MLGLRTAKPGDKATRGAVQDALCSQFVLFALFLILRPRLVLASDPLERVVPRLPG